jgi:pimeloyl-ACP methyl ester carboxylesterase
MAMPRFPVDRAVSRKRLLAGAAALGAAGAAAQLLHMRRIARDPARATLEHPADGRTVDVHSADGTHLHAEVFGPDDGQPIVLVHGWTENLSIWTHVIRELAGQGFRVIACDLRGHGQSQEAASGDYSVRRYGEDIEAVLESCVAEGEQAVIAGHSLGAMAIVAWAEGRTITRRIGAIALVTTGFGDLVNDALVIPVPGLARAVNKVLPARHFLGAPGPLPSFSSPISYALIRYVAFGPTASPAQVAFFERMLASSPPRARSATGIALSDVELHHALPQLTVPTVVLAGEKDRLTPPSHARRVADELPRLHRLVVLPKTGHMAPLERPHEVTEVLTELAAVARDAPAVAA